jgi:hypothetical protein
VGFLDDLVRGIETAGQGQAMGAVFAQFIRESQGSWQSDAYVVSLGSVSVAARMRTLESGHEGIEVLSSAVRPPAVRILRRRGWGQALVPPWVTPLLQLPTIDSDPLLGAQTQSDEPEPSALAALAPSWEQAVRAAPYAMLASDGWAITAQIAPPMSVSSVHAVAAAVAALAMTCPMTLTLAALEDASPTQGGDLSPSVSLAPDGLQIGVGGGRHVVARLGGLGGITEIPPEMRSSIARAGAPAFHVVGGVGTLTWTHIERDLGRLRAGIEALRQLAGAAAPYR